jgi:hypothetical protein
MFISWREQSRVPEVVPVSTIEKPAGVKTIVRVCGVGSAPSV